MMAPLDSTGNWERTLNPGLQTPGGRGGIDVRPVAEEPAEPLLARRYGYAAAFDEIGGHDGWRRPAPMDVSTGERSESENSQTV
jgi:hypothetical protein